MKEKRRFGFLDPKVVMTVIVSLIILGAGAFAFFTVWGSINTSSSTQLGNTMCTDVTDPSVSQTLTLINPGTIVSVTETLSSGGTQTISSSDYTLNTATGVITVTVTG